MRAGRREWLLGLASLAACLAAGAVAEAVLRWHRPAFLAETPVASPVVYSGVYGWELRRSWRGQDGSGARITLDVQRRRVTPGPGQGLPVVGRVAMLGDSIAFGTGVDDEHTFAYRLQQLDPRLDVRNLAVPGYGTDQELLRLEREAPSLRPDVVVLHFCVANDLVDNSLDHFLYDPRRPKPYFTLEDGRLRPHDAHLRLSWHVRLASALRERSYLLNALSTDGAPALAKGRWQKDEARAMRELEANAALTFRQVAELDAVSRRHGGRLVVVVHPDRSSFEGESELADLAVGRLPAEAVVVDLRHEYHALGLDFREVALDPVGHLNPRGHDLVARVLHAVIMEALRLPRRAGA